MNFLNKNKRKGMMRENVATRARAQPGKSGGFESDLGSILLIKIMLFLFYFFGRGVVQLPIVKFNW
jgi:hypothetical protein